MDYQHTKCSFYVVNLQSEGAKALAAELSSEVGLKILKELYRNPLSVMDLSANLEIPVSTVQYHVNRLLELGVIREAERKLGKRLRDVKTYVYDKEGIIFLNCPEPSGDTTKSE
ncbi:MAG: Transcriptional regulatory protein, ArsR family [Archaeoglobus fulgidus]|uniref:Transcriptional regulatory protein, ArsR family n=1 Tax=Archaeoglobus fulgidus TaxID=2234 RepID=A0A101DCH8_ARCFL|nr:winged helix-turn-helix domain-containing protein [Archaeoglobus fulgidus]KUJ93037.1 MAG: Transcriptional regulatory protein, ArsR family [Archaeoglobus fulgidus]KUK06581.1 MAG: Transcriptional regulatory protein, ArsR family [Archaeoglobus fulgidus]